MGLTMRLLEPSQYEYVSIDYITFDQLRRQICDVANVRFIEYLDKQKDDGPFYELRNHSDCDGQLSSFDCEQLLKDFEEYEEAFRTKYPESYEVYYDMMELIRECVDCDGIIDFR